MWQFAEPRATQKQDMKAQLLFDHLEVSKSFYLSNKNKNKKSLFCFIYLLKYGRRIKTQINFLII